MTKTKSNWLLTLVVLFQTHTLLAQQPNQLVLPGIGGLVQLKEMPYDSTYVIPFTLLNANRNLTWVVTALPIGTTNSLDYTLVSPTTGTLTSGAFNIFSLALRVRNRNLHRDSVFFALNIELQDGTGTISSGNLTVSIQSRNPISRSIPDTSKWTLRLLTGTNFDFFGNSLFKNFSGDLNFWLPDAVPILWGKCTLGLEGGFFNFRYYEADSTGGNLRTDKYLVNPADIDLLPGTQYIEENYALNSRTNFNVVGAYLNPIIRLTPRNFRWVDLFLSLHVEGLWRTEVITNTKVVYRKETFTVGSTRPRGIQRYQGLRPSYAARSYNDTYFGIGMPVKFNLRNIFEVYIAPTIGWANYEYTVSIPGQVSEVSDVNYFTSYSNNAFLLTKAKITATTGVVGLTIGGEFRRILGQKTFYSVYTGAVLPIEKWFK